MNLREKLSAIQQKIKVPKNLKNSFGGYMYRNAEGILEAVKPFEKEYSVAIAIDDDLVMMGERYYVKATATLFDLESDDTLNVSAFARESANKKGMDDSQITGTASSYARKYALNGLFLLDDTKDADTEEFQNQIRPESASSAQVKTVEDICKKNKVNIDELYRINNIEKENITATQAGQLLRTLKQRFGDE